MKIVVRSAAAENVKLRLPSALALNPVSALFLPKLLKRSGLAIDRKQAQLLVKAINQYRHSHPDWKLVEVESADGEYVEVTI